jgi:hypothetical protein
MITDKGGTDTRMDELTQGTKPSLREDNVPSKTLAEGTKSFCREGGHRVPSKSLHAEGTKSFLREGGRKVPSKSLAEGTKSFLGHRVPPKSLHTEGTKSFLREGGGHNVP